MTDLRDATGQTLQPGDLLLNDQGRVWVVQPTDRLTAAQCVAVVIEAKHERGQWSRGRQSCETTYLRLGNAIRVMPQTLHRDRTENRRLFDRLYALMVAPAKQAELAARKQAIKDHKSWIKEEQNG